MEIELIRNDSAPERVVKQLLENIKNGNMSPGERLLPQDKLAEKFGVGRSSVREATNALAIMGYLKIIQGKGTFIREKLPPDRLPEPSCMDIFAAADLFNLAEIREVLECHIVEKAASRGGSRQLDLLGQAVEKLEKCADEKEKFLKEDLNFHLSIANAANLPEVGKIVEVIYPRINKMLSVIFTTSKPEAVISAIDSAKMVYASIISGEGKQAARNMRYHLDTPTGALRKAFQMNINDQ